MVDQPRLLRGTGETAAARPSLRPLRRRRPADRRRRGLLLRSQLCATEHAEQTARNHAEFIATAILPDRLRGSDFAAPPHGRRLAELDRLSRRELLQSGGLRVKLYDPAGVVV